tara:strand:+ start:819 stop:1031 length:213 start_codon:yes stop_codon:yes gene_type:complete
MHKKTAESVEDLIGHFDSLTAFAKELKHKHPSTAHSWKKKGVIPHWRRGEILKVCKKKKIHCSEGLFSDA